MVHLDSRGYVDYYVDITRFNRDGKFCAKLAGFNNREHLIPVVKSDEGHEEVELFLCGVKRELESRV